MELPGIQETADGRCHLHSKVQIAHGAVQLLYQLTVLRSMPLAVGRLGSIQTVFLGPEMLHQVDRKGGQKRLIRRGSAISRPRQTSAIR